MIVCMCVSINVVSKLHTFLEERTIVGLKSVSSHSLTIHCSPLLHPDT